MRKNRRKTKTCPNCAYQFAGMDNFCPNCGQENHSHHAPFKHLALELVESLTHFDTKFFQTTKALALKPGRLTKDYIEDKRARYVPPVRLYVFVSFVFFFALSLFSDTEYEINREPANASVPADTATGFRISTGSSGVSINDRSTATRYADELKGRKHITNETIDSLIETKEPDRNWFRGIMLRQTIKQELGMISEEAMKHSLFKNAGIGLFILMPVFALLLKLLYLQRKKFDATRPKRLYIEHLIFSVHFHSFVFALLLIALLIAPVTNDWFTVAAVLFIPIYGTIAMRRVYERSWKATVWRALVLFPSYSIVLVVAMLVVLFLSFATL